MATVQYGELLDLFELYRKESMGVPLNHKNVAVTVHTEVVNVVECLLILLQWLQDTVFVDWGLSTRARDDFVVFIKNDHKPRVILAGALPAYLRPADAHVEVLSMNHGLSTVRTGKMGFVKKLAF